MADAPAFTPAHKVMIDALTVIVTRRMDDARHQDWPRMAAEMLRDVLPQVTLTGRREIDALAQAARQLVTAQAALSAGAAGAALTWAEAEFRASQALHRFACARLAQSAAAMFPQPEPEAAT